MLVWRHDSGVQKACRGFLVVSSFWGLIFNLYLGFRNPKSYDVSEYLLNSRYSLFFYIATKPAVGTSLEATKAWRRN